MHACKTEAASRSVCQRVCLCVWLGVLHARLVRLVSSSSSPPGHYTQWLLAPAMIGTGIYAHQRGAREFSVNTLAIFGACTPVHASPCVASGVAACCVRFECGGMWLRAWGRVWFVYPLVPLSSCVILGLLFICVSHVAAICPCLLRARTQACSFRSGPRTCLLLVSLLSTLHTPRTCPCLTSPFDVPSCYVCACVDVMPCHVVDNFCSLPGSCWSSGSASVSSMQRSGACPVRFRPAPTPSPPLYRPPLHP